MPVWRGEQQEAILIRQILGGRRDLLANLIEPPLEPLWWTVKAKVRDDADTDDIVQEAVFKAPTYLGQYRFEASFRSWLTQISINEVSQLWRKKFASGSASWDPQAIAAIKVVDSKESLFNACTRTQNARLLQLALASRPEKYRVMVRMRDLEERTIIEVAHKLRFNGCCRENSSPSRSVANGEISVSKKQTYPLKVALKQVRRRVDMECIIKCNRFLYEARPCEILPFIRRVKLNGKTMYDGTPMIERVATG
jgi:RNA polymerase sigma factor (sigma-70 family)